MSFFVHLLDVFFYVHTYFNKSINKNVSLILKISINMVKCFNMNYWKLIHLCLKMLTILFVKVLIFVYKEVNCFCIYCILFESAIVHYKLQIFSNCSYIWFLIILVTNNYLNYTDPDDPYKLNQDTRMLGLVVCRGTSVVLICPVDGMESIQNPFIQQEG